MGNEEVDNNSGIESVLNQRGSRRRFLSASIIAGGLLLAGCADKVGAAATVVDRLTNTPRPTDVDIDPTGSATATEEATATIEPTISPQDVAKEMGLDYSNIGKGYHREFISKEIGKETYLVDTFNSVPKAVKQEDGTWRKLDYHNDVDKDLMYSRFAPLERKYFETDGNFIHDTTLNYMGVIIHPVYTGDWFTRKAKDFDGNTISLYYAVTVVRDQNNEVQVIELGFDADGMAIPHGTPYSVYDPDGTHHVYIYDVPEKTIPYQLPGMKLNSLSVVFAYKDKKAIVPPFVPDNPDPNYWGWDRSELLRLRPWFVLHPMDGQLTYEEGIRTTKEKGWWPDRVVIGQSFEGFFTDDAIE